MLVSKVSDLYKIFDDSCIFSFSPNVEGNIQSGKLKIRIENVTRQQKLSRVEIQFEAEQGIYDIYVGSSNTRLTISSGVQGRWEFRLWRRGIVEIGAGTTSNNTKVVVDDSIVRVGEDCMFSSDILIQSNDQHGIIDLSTGNIINALPKEVLIGDHVWLGRKSILIGALEVGNGSTVAAGAVLAGSVPKFSIMAGNPAKLVKSEVTWSRFPDRLDEKAQCYITEFNSSQDSYK